MFPLTTLHMVISMLTFDQVRLLRLPWSRGKTISDHSYPLWSMTIWIQVPYSVAIPMQSMCQGSGGNMVKEGARQSIHPSRYCGCMSILWFWSWKASSNEFITIEEEQNKVNEIQSLVVVCYLAILFQLIRSTNFIVLVISFELISVSSKYVPIMESPNWHPYQYSDNP